MKVAFLRRDRDILLKTFGSLSASHWQHSAHFAVGLPSVSMGFVLHPVSLSGIGVSTKPSRNAYMLLHVIALETIGALEAAAMYSLTLLRAIESGLSTDAQHAAE